MADSKPAKETLDEKVARQAAENFPAEVLEPWKALVRDLQLRGELHGDWSAGMRPLLGGDEIEYTISRGGGCDCMWPEKAPRWRTEICGPDRVAILRSAQNVDMAYI
jgi:hypothetical protein